MMARYEIENGVIRYYPNGKPAAKVVAEKPAKKSTKKKKL